MGERNFSRFFEFVDADRDGCAVQNLVYLVAEMVSSDLPDLLEKHDETAQLSLVCRKYGKRLLLATPEERKSRTKARKAIQTVKANPTLTSKTFSLLSEATRYSEAGSEEMVEAMTLRSGILAQEKNWAEAVRDLKTAVEECKEDNHEARFRLEYRLAQIYSKAGLSSEAVATLNRALSHLEKSDLPRNQKESHSNAIRTSMEKLKKKKNEDEHGIETKVELLQPDKADNPSLSSLISVQSSPGRGRFSVASKAVAAGSVLAVEDPAVAMVNPDVADLMLKYCVCCLAPCERRSLPCLTCSSVVFCGAECRSAYSVVHAFECTINLYRHRLETAGAGFRSFLALKAILQVSYQDLKRKCFGSRLGSLLKMESHRADRTSDEKIKHLVITTLLYGLLEDCDYLEASDDPDIDVLETIHTLVLVQDVNTHPIMCLDSGGARCQVGLERLGNAINPSIGSVLNHSCCPNTIRVNVGRKTVIVAARNIAEGEEICDIYSMHYSEIGRADRRSWLRDMFFFECQCLACTQDWPTYDRLPSSADSETMSMLRQVEMGMEQALRRDDTDCALMLHFKDLAILARSNVAEPHALFVSLRNSMQFCMWKKYAARP